MKLKFIPKTDKDYIQLYAEALKRNPKLFKQQKMLIDSQLKASKSLFKNFDKEEEFKLNARRYLRGVGLLK